MDSSLSLLTAQVHFLDTDLSLIHVPLSLYGNFVQSLIALVLPAEASSNEAVESASSDHEATRPKRPWAYDHPFVNISITPVELSVACSVSLAERLFKPVLDSLNQNVRNHVSISSERYVVIQVDGEGLDAGQRVLELSSPLAMSGISIFFYSTYFSDYILVPLRSRQKVITALEERNFVFSKESEGFVNVSSPLMRPSQHRDSGSSTSDNQPESYLNSPDPIKPPSTPPPSSVAELETRTFNTLRKRKVVPSVDPSIQLVQCAGRKDTLRAGNGSHSSSTNVKQRLQLGLVKCLTTFPRPRFFSLTLTDTEPASLLLEKHLLVNFESTDSANHGTSDDQVLLGNKADVLIPIMLDLKNLPIESTGIVCGIAGRLVGRSTQDTTEHDLELEQPLHAHASFPFNSNGVDLSYLSTARAGALIIKQEELKSALIALKGRVDEGVGGLPIDDLDLNDG